MNGRRWIAGLVVPVLIVVLFSMPAGAVLSPGTSPRAPLAVASTVPASIAIAPGSPPIPVATPAGGTVTVCPPPPGNPVWGFVDGVAPVAMSQGLQYPPCPPIGQDESRATFSSSVAGSGSHWEIPVWLAPGTNEPEGSPINHFTQESVGIIVGGDNFSAWRQSYAEVVFTPTGAGTSTDYQASFHIFSLEPQAAATGAPAGNGLLLTWNQTWYLEDDYANTTMVNGFAIPGGATVDVAFAGQPGSAAGMSVWINDTDDSSLSADYILSSANLGGPYNFTPYYSTACSNNCILQWAFEFGEGVGFSNCPLNAAASNPCSSYNQGFWTSSPSPSFGIPQFWRNGGYHGDFQEFSPVSNSGVCNGLAPPDTTTTCFSFDIYNGSGYYPYFTFNGTGFDFGSNSSYTLENLGGYSFEYPASGSARNIVPEFFYRDANDSRAGYIPSGASLGVSADMLDLGSIAYVNATYSLNGGAPVTLPLTWVNGTRSFGNWTGAIPAGPDGTINYTLSATNNASVTISTPTLRVVRGPLPTFYATVVTQDPACAMVVVNGTSYLNGSTFGITPGFYSLYAAGCYPWVFAGWKTVTGGAAALQPGSLSSTLELSASGTIEALWTYVRPNDTVTIEISPVCGQVFLNGNPEGSGAVVSLLDSATYPIGHVGCANEAFRGWTFSGEFVILGNNLTVDGNGSLTANYVPSSTASALVFQTSPGTCGGVLFYGAGYTSNESVSVGPGGYPIGPDPCPHWGFQSFSFNGQGSVPANNTWLTLTGGGTLTEINYVLTEVTFVINPAFCGPVVWDGANESNGATIVVGNDSSHAVYAAACPNHYLIALTGAGGVSVIGNVATVTGSGTVTASYGTGNASQFLGFLTDPSTCGGIIEGGTEYTDSQYTYLAPGTIATVSSVPCPGYGFLEWVTFGLVQVDGSTAFFNGSGALEAVFRPLTGLLIFTSPTGCGSVSIGPTVYPGNSTVSVTEGVSYGVQAIPCAGDAFVQWINSSGAELAFGPYAANNSVSALADSILTAQFAPVRYTVTIGVTPVSCGAVRISGAEYINGSTLTVPIGVYPISTDPCTGDHLLRWTVTGGVTVVGSSLYVNASGSVSADYQPVPPSVAISVSNSSFAGDAVVISATVGVPIPPFDYNYTWFFGDGSAPVTTPVNFTAHTFNSPGRYNVSVIVVDPINRTANASQFILIVAGSVLSSALLTPLSLAAIALVVIVAILAIAVVIVGRGSRPDPEVESDTPVPGDAEPVPAPLKGTPTSGEESKP